MKHTGLAGDVTQVEIEPRVGSRFKFADMRERREAVLWGTCLEMERPRTLDFRWFTSEGDEKDIGGYADHRGESDGCVATITHRMDAKYSEYVDRTERGWDMMLGRIEALLSGSA